LIKNTSTRDSETTNPWTWTRENSKKSGPKAIEWPAAPSIKWGLSWKHLGIAQRTSIDQKDFNQRQ
jgi:hypothetical protein